MDYLQLWKDGWNYYRQHPVFVVPYLIWFLVTATASALILPSLFKSLLAGLNGNLGASLPRLGIFSILALSNGIISRLFAGWTLEMIRLADAGETVSLRSSFNSYKSKIVSYIGASLLKYLITLVIPLLIILAALLGVSSSQGAYNLASPGSPPAQALINLFGLLLNPLVLLVALVSVIYMIVASFLLVFVDQSVIVANQNAWEAIKDSYLFVRQRLLSTFIFLLIYVIFSSLLIIPGVLILSQLLDFLTPLYIYLLSPWLVSVMTLFFIRGRQE